MRNRGDRQTSRNVGSKIFKPSDESVAVRWGRKEKIRVKKSTR